MSGVFELAWRFAAFTFMVERDGVRLSARHCTQMKAGRDETDAGKRDNLWTGSDERIVADVSLTTILMYSE